MEFFYLPYSPTLFLLLYEVITGFCNLETNLDIPGKTESQLRNYQNHIGLKITVCGIFGFLSDVAKSNPQWRGPHLSM